MSTVSLDSITIDIDWGNEQWGLSCGLCDWFHSIDAIRPDMGSLLHLAHDHLDTHRQPRHPHSFHPYCHTHHDAAEPCPRLAQECAPLIDARWLGFIFVWPTAPGLRTIQEQTCPLP